MHTPSFSPDPSAWRFAKMHGAGNDFVVLDGVSQAIDLTPELARRLADRHFGIGADQILIVENPMHPEADFRYRIFNADGGEVEHCGNGARCFARFVRDQGLSRRNPLRAEICTGLITLTLEDSGDVRVNMGQVSFEPDSLPFAANGLVSRQQHDATLWQLPLEGLPDAQFAALSISNPHAVLIVDDIITAPVNTLGPAITHHPRFANEVNTGFLQIIDRHNAKLRVYERGAGETLSCGTGACAAAITGIRMGLLDSPIKMQTRGGCLTIAWDDVGLRMSGPATTVFQGWINPHTLVRPTEFKDTAA